MTEAVDVKTILPQTNATDTIDTAQIHRKLVELSLLANGDKTRISNKCIPPHPISLSDGYHECFPVSLTNLPDGQTIFIVGRTTESTRPNINLGSEGKWTDSEGRHSDILCFQTAILIETKEGVIRKVLIANLSDVAPTQIHQAGVKSTQLPSFEKQQLWQKLTCSSLHGQGKSTVDNGTRLSFSRQSAASEYEPVIAAGLSMKLKSGEKPQPIGFLLIRR